MKIGLSYSRCVRDIVDGKVSIDDVLVIISRTDFNPRDDDEWAGIWHGYRSRNGLSLPEWISYKAEDEEKFRNVSIELLEQGKFHQPRQFGAYPRRLPHIWLDTILPSEDLEANPSVKAAWEKFLMIAELSSVNVDAEPYA